MASALARRSEAAWPAVLALMLLPALSARANIIEFSPMDALGGGARTLTVQDGDAIMLADLLIGPSGAYDIVNVEGGLLSISGTLELASAGQLNVTGGTLRAVELDMTGGVLDFSGGTLQTMGVDGDLISDGGTLQTWSSLGIDTVIQGDLEMRDGAINLALVNTYPQGFRQWRWNKVVAAGDIACGGTLDVSMVLKTQAMMAEGLVFDMLDWSGQLTGRFDQVVLPQLPAGLGWNTDNLYTTGEILVIPEPAAIALIALGGAVLLTRRRPLRRS